MLWRALTILVALAACTSQRAGAGSTATRHRFRNHDHGYRVAYAQGTHRFISDEWRVESHETNGDEIGRKKDADDYVYRLQFDIDGDGRDEDLGYAYYYDLRLDHRRNNGRIWLRTFPVPDSARDRDLSVLVQNFVENIAANGYFTADVREREHVTVEERRYATQVLDTQRVSVSQHEAAAVMFDVANVNQLQMSASARSARAMVVMARTPYHYVIRNGAGGRSWPILMLIGYANAPADFDAGLPDFQRFVQAIELRPPAE